ncbi:MAG: hypothetical protein FJX65_11395 [Alphaproteobacteria bacterium]|nr:hypothetical protein [Alphaproteobacteria bacterium]
MAARLAGVNTPFAGSRRSVDAEGLALERTYLAGLAADLDRAHLFEATRGGALDREIARELHALSRGDPTGVTDSVEARTIAQVVHRYQVLAVDGLNRAGAWIGRYEGYIARTSHDPDRLRRAGYTAWRDTITPLLEARTVEGIAEPEAFLRSVYDALVSGIHLTPDGLQGFKDPAFKGPGNLAKRLSQSRLLHFKDADAWMDYHDAFGAHSLIEDVLGSPNSKAPCRGVPSSSARRTARTSAWRCRATTPIAPTSP